MYSSPPATCIIHPGLILSPPLQGPLMAFSWGIPESSVFSLSSSAALAVMDGIFLQIFLADNTAASRFSYLRCSLARSSSGLFLDHLHSHHPRHYLKYAGIFEVCLQSFYQSGCWQEVDDLLKCIIEESFIKGLYKAVHVV